MNFVVFQADKEREHRRQLEQSARSDDSSAGFITSPTNSSSPEDPNTPSGISEPVSPAAPTLANQEETLRILLQEVNLKVLKFSNLMT